MDALRSSRYTERFVAVTPGSARSFLSKNWLVHGIMERELARVFPQYLRGRLIDIGCAGKPYAALARPFVSEHVGVDHALTLHDKSKIDIDATAYAIPVPDASFDSALCTAVLEHLEEPEAALRECLRVLRPGGHAVYVAPLFWHVHESPRDFFRYTQHGLEHLARKAGFEVVEIRPLSGFWTTFGQLLSYVGHRRNRGRVRRTRIIPLLGGVVQAVGSILDDIDPAPEFTWAYMAVVRKPLTQAVG